MRYYNKNSNRENAFEPLYKRLNESSSIGTASRPYMLDVELTNHCNMNCIFCGQQTMTREKGFMDDETFNKIVEEASVYKTPIRLIRWGEPLLHPKSMDYCWQICDSDIPLHITTNGLLLTEDNIQGLLDMSMPSLTISMQGATKEEYESMRNNNKYDILKLNILDMVEARGSKDAPNIQISCTMTDDKQDDIDRFVDYWSNLVDLVSIGKTDLYRINSDNIKNKVVRDRIVKLKSRIKKTGYRYNCPDMFGKISVDWDGKVTACCSDYDNYLTVGDINNDTLMEVWDGVAMNSLRNLMRENMHHCISLCSTCYNTETELEK